MKTRDMSYRKERQALSLVRRRTCHRFENSQREWMSCSPTLKRHPYKTPLASAGSGWVEQRRGGRGRPSEFSGEPAAQRDPTPPLGEADLPFRPPSGDRPPRAPVERRELP